MQRQEQKTTPAYSEKDIQKKSKDNLTAVKDRLKKGTLLPTADLQALQKEKQPSEIITPRETLLLLKLLDRKYLLSHTTSISSYEKIISQQALFEATKFGISTSQSPIPYFLRNQTHPETKKAEDYVTLKIDFGHLVENHPNIAESMWTSGDFDDFVIPSEAPKAGSHLANLATALFGPKGSFGMGDSSYSLTLKEQPSEEKTTTPIRMMKKILTFKREDTIDHEAKNEAAIKQSISINDEIASGRDIIPFIAFTFLERLRLLGGTLREYLLKNPNDDQMIDYVLGIFFRIGDFEIHIPSKLSLSSQSFVVTTPQMRKQMTEAVTRASAAGDLETLEKLFNDGHPLDGYMYEDKFHFDNTPPTVLPLISAIRAEQLAAVNWLIDHGAHRSIFTFNSDSNSEILRQVSFDENQMVMIATAAFESGNIEIINTLIQRGFDINSHYKYLCEDRKEDPQKRYYTHDSDKFFVELLKVVSKTKRLDMLDAALAHLDYVKDPKVLKRRILLDMAHFASPLVFTHLLKKLDIDTDKLLYADLFIKAADNDNFELARELFKHVRFIQRNFSQNQIMEFFFSGMKDKRYEVYYYDLMKIAGENLSKGNIEAAEWYLKKAEPLVEEDYGIGLTLTNAKSEGIEKLIHWLIKTLHITPTREIKQHIENKSTTLLSQAIKFQKNALVKKLMEEYKIPCDAPLASGKTPFVEAIMADNIELIDLFSASGAAVPNDAEALKHLVSNKKLATLQSLFQHGLQITDTDILLIALAESSPEIVDLMLSSQKELKPPTQDHAKELFVRAFEKKNVPMLTWLKQHYQFDTKFLQDNLVTSLPISKLFSFEPEMEWLLAENPDVSLPDSSGHTALDKILFGTGAFTQVHCELLDFLQTKGIDIDNALKKHGLNLLMRAIESDNDWSTSFLQESAIPYLLNKGISLNQVFKRDTIIPSEKIFFPNCVNMTPLEFACSLGKVSVVKQLMEAGALASFVHDADATALHYACGLPTKRFDTKEPAKTPQISLETIQLLLACGARASIGIETPLMLLRKQEEISEEIVDAISAAEKAQALPKPAVAPTQNTFLTKNQIVDHIFKGYEYNENYPIQKRGLLAAIEAVENKEPISIELMKKIHFAFMPRPGESYISPECRPPAGEFRDECVSSEDIRKTLTKQGVMEILDIMHSESKEDFSKYQGTLLGIIDPKTRNISRDALQYLNLSIRQGKLTKEGFAEEIVSEARKSRHPYVLYNPRSNSDDLSIREYMDSALRKLLKNYNAKIKLLTDTDDKIKLIVELIKKCERLTPFRDGNHRAFVIGLLNVLLLNEGIGYCKLQNRRVFIPNGLDESVAEVKKGMVYCQLASKAVTKHIQEEKLTGNKEVQNHGMFAHSKSSAPGKHVIRDIPTSPRLN